MQKKKTGKTLLSPPHPGIQLYHSLLCVVLQFLILRLMGRTITAVLTTFCFQMVNVFPWAAQVTADSSWGRGGWGLWCRGSRGLGEPVSNPFSPRHLAVWLWVTCQKPQVFHLQAAVTMLHQPQGRGAGRPLCIGLCHWGSLSLTRLAQLSMRGVT